jgi:perosamine synthetase
MIESSMQKKEKINYAGPWITEKEIEAVSEAVKNGFYQNYRFHAKSLETMLCSILNIKHALATNSGTAAIHLALLSLGLNAGDEVITTDSSCVASAIPIVYCGAIPVFVDVDPDTWCLSPASVRKAITEKTKAILVVHWNGHPAAMDEIMEIAIEKGLSVIEDGAPALGAEYKGRKVGTIGAVGCFSFQGAKIAIAGMGGAVVTNNSDAYEKMCIYASYGRTDSQKLYWSDYVGYNYNMPNLPAALATAQVRRLDELLKKKREIWDWYVQGLADFPNIKLIGEARDTRSTYCYPPLLIKESVKRSRNDILEDLQRENIDARPAQPRLSLMPMFQSRFENCESDVVEQRGILLPAAFNVTKEDIGFVCSRIRELVY